MDVPSFFAIEHETGFPDVIADATLSTFVGAEFGDTEEEVEVVVGATACLHAERRMTDMKNSDIFFICMAPYGYNGRLPL